MATMTSQPTAIPAQTGEAAPTAAADAGSRTRSAAGTVIGNMLLLAGVAVLAFAGYLVGGSRLQAAHSQHLLYDQLRVSLGEAVTPVAEPIAPGTPIALLQSPRLGSSEVVVEGTSSRNLMRGPGHRPDTPLPGQQGVSVLMGRSSTFGSPFAAVHHLVPGDVVSVTTGQGRYSYKIDSVRRSDTAFQALVPAAARLSLVTSDGSWAPSHLWVASGVLVQGTAQAAPAALSPAPVADQPLQGDPGAAVALLLWSQLLLVVAVAGVWGWLRLPRVIIWIGVAPVALAVAWNVFTDLSALLPNLL